MPVTSSRRPKTLDFLAFSVGYNAIAATSGGGVSLPEGQWSIRPAMLTARLARKLLALTIAYAIVLGGVVGPVLGHGFDPAQELCSPAGQHAALGKLPGSPAEAPSHPDCCPALCGSLAAILPPAPGVAQVHRFSGFLVPAAFVTRSISENHRWMPARAPPAG